MRTHSEPALVRRSLVAAALLGAGACFDAAPPPTGPARGGLSIESRIDCVASTIARTVACSPTGAPDVMQEVAGTAGRFALRGPQRDVILGNQGGYVKLISSNVGIVAGVFSFDVRLRNLIAQPIGTTNGFSADPTGSRVFFATGPTVTSMAGGTIDFVDGAGFFHDGTGTFTASNQPFFRYVGLLNTGDTSAVKRWSLRFDPAVSTFAFSVFVSTPVQFQNGYVNGNPNVLTLNYGEVSSSLGGTVRSAVGNPVGGVITYASDDASIASVSAGGQVTGGPARGITSIVLSSGGIPNYRSTAVNVCSTTPTIVSGATVNGAIAANDCYSSFAGNLNRPASDFRSDLFRVSLTAGQQIAITMTTNDPTVPFISLANPSGVLEAGALGSGNTATIVAGAPVQQTGIYTIEAGQANPFDIASGEPGYTGGYSLVVTVSP